MSEEKIVMHARVPASMYKFLTEYAHVFCEDNVSQALRALLGLGILTFQQSFPKSKELVNYSP